MIGKSETTSKEISFSSSQILDVGSCLCILYLVEHHFNTFERLQTELESLDESQLEVDHRTTFEDTFCEVKSAIIERMSELRRVDTLSSTRVVAPSPSTPRHSLPKLQVTKFSGSYTEWLDFFNMFTTLVHNNSGLEDIEKFQYLRSCLTHNAFRLVQSLEVTCSNYKRAIEVLITRYDNKRYIFQSHLQAILNCKGTRPANASSLREFVDSINAHLRAMQSFASPNQIADGILLQLIVAKLDPDMQVKWEEEIVATCDKASSPSLHLPSWDDLTKFIERRCQTVSIIEANKGSLGKGTSTAATKSSGQKSTFTATANNNKCTLCNESNHHTAFKCTKFTLMDPMKRYILVKNNRLCFNCLGAKSQQPSVGDQALHQASTSALHAGRPHQDVILATALVQLHNTHGTTLMARALLDSGSQLSFISERIAQLLRVKRNKVTTEISGNGSMLTTSRYSAVIEIKSLHSGFAALTEVVIMPSISSSQPQKSIDIVAWSIPKNIALADDTFNTSGPIDLLIGASLFFDILSVGQIKIGEELPILQKTQLGWIVAGAINSRSALSSSSLPTAVSLLESVNPPTLTQSPLDESLERFWRLEDTARHQANSRTSPEEECEAHFRQNTTRCPLTNKFIVRLPFSEEPSVLGQSIDIAKRRFYAMEKRVLRDPVLKTEYSKFMHVYIELKHMTLVDPHEFTAKVGTYIPHHCVKKMDSSTTKLRVVFDASCSTSNGRVLNSILRVGPNLQDDIVTILLRFRTHRYVLMADIAKMYRQIIVDPRDAKWQCILWRNTPNEPLATYQLQTVTYGTSCAPFLAVRCLQQLAHENMSAYPIGAPITLRDFYVDNLMTGGATIDEVNSIKTEFASNSDDIIVDVAAEDREQIVNVDDKAYVKALGLKWSPRTDCFMFSYTPPGHQSPKVTKRTILSQVASFFDPLGLLNPVMVKCKILMQQQWKLRLEWKGMCHQLSFIDGIQTPRFFVYDADTVIHAFADASSKAYDACTYAVNQSISGPCATLLCAKSRVAPTKEITLPRLELCAATLLAELLHSVISIFAYKVTPSNVHCWSDSTITLSWIQREAYHWTTFVSNRVAKIQQLTGDFSWHHVPSVENPTDLVSRGVTVKDIAANSLWFHGPEFLVRDSRQWPNNSVHIHDVIPEQRKHDIYLTISPQPDIIAEHKYVNSYNKLLRIFAYINRFISSLRHIPFEAGPITASELDSFLLLICENIQRTAFAKEYKELESGGSHKSRWET
ncbi:uncharacterized protein LOC118739764 [Rhagoletis pomonella]|uniref:uncharacterized protein LOC118739764 n=1 Tax=Rhagoletis pomonella TaxID=28610 RepID=UPI00178277E1|nr:uncharacterized protein LOC118739764 [Rhagoletis pomonella]